MKQVGSPHDARQLVSEWRSGGESIGFVPTMGALHEGHLALARAAREENSKFVASIFVNPTQFAAGEDYTRYPRPAERDSDLLRGAGCDLLFVPSAAQMYGGSSVATLPDGLTNDTTWVEVGGLSDLWEGRARPGHLRGVATVVAKLFNITLPHRAYFGEKDYQQLKVIGKMVADLFLNVEVVPIATLRDADGVALSSRNTYLKPSERLAATALPRALRAGAAAVQNGENDVALLRRVMHEICDAEPLVDIDYLAVVDANTLAPLQKLGDEPARALVAARVGTTRLIDNVSMSRS